MRYANIVTIYKFSELSEDAQQAAKDSYAAGVGYNWADDAMASIKALAEHFGGKMTDWSIDWFGGSYSSAKFDMPELTVAEIRERLKQLGSYNKRTGKGHGDCKLTGYCMDEDAIDGLRLAFRKGERDLGELMDAAFDSWLKSAQADCEDQFSDEQFAEHCDVNGYEFDEDGSMV